jgi:putative ABC transport system permease protein
MLKNYIKIALRNILRSKVYSFINILGLSIGIACSIMILLWVHDEMSYDKAHSNLDRLYQVYINAEFDGKINTWSSVPLPTAEGLRETDSKIKHAVTADWGHNHLLTVGETRINKRGYSVTPEFLEMFQFPLLHGQAEKVLDDPYSIVLTESTARALFGDKDPINQTVIIDNADELKVTGILKDIPGNSSFQFDVLVPFAIFEKQEWVKNSRDNWGNYSFQVYVELKEGAAETAVEASIRDLLTRKGQTDIKREFFLHPMERWRLHSEFEDGKESGGLIEYVNMFSMVAVFILVIACINFMNLATARSERRAREVGIRKSVGSKRKEIVIQFLGESVLIAFIAFAIALLLAQLLLPAYNSLIEKKLVIDYSSPWYWMVALLLIFVTGVLAGSYPAFYLSSFNVVRVLKGKIQVGKGATTPRKVLVVLQFVFSITLIVCSVVLQQQINHVKNRQLGYDQENLITIPYTTEIGKNYKVLKQELLGSGAVESVTKSNSPVTDIHSRNFLDWPGKPEDQKVIFTTIATEYDYTKTMGIKILEGRDFSEDFVSDTSAIVINKAAVDLMGLKDPVGTTVGLWGGKRTIIGVCENVLMGSLFGEVAPMFLVMIPDWAGSLTIRLSPTDDLQGTLKRVESVFRKYNSAYPFEYSFVDVEFGKKFQSINMIGKLGGVFTFLAICITGLGLFGLAAFTAQQRTKEVGIRKVLGASVTNLVMLISGEFTLLVIVGFILSAPLAWWGAGALLERYEYKIETPLWVFPLSGFIALIFTLVIVSTQALKAASANPVNSLRNE